MTPLPQILKSARIPGEKRFRYHEDPVVAEEIRRVERRKSTTDGAAS